MVDSYGDSWNGATIVVKQDGEEIGRATIADGSVAVAAFTYDNNSEYTFYWENGDYDGECSFVILVDGAQVFVAEEGSCSYSADEPFYVLVANWDAGIEQSALSIEQSAIIYDLQGRRVSEPQKGMMYIVGGKKVIF